MFCGGEVVYPGNSGDYKCSDSARFRKNTFYVLCIAKLLVVLCMMVSSETAGQHCNCIGSSETKLQGDCLVNVFRYWPPKELWQRGKGNFFWPLPTVQIPDIKTTIINSIPPVVHEQAKLTQVPTFLRHSMLCT